MSAPVPAKINLRVAQFIALRDKMKAMDAAHAEKMKPFKQMRDLIGGYLMQVMSTGNMEGIKTDAGTCYKTTKVSASLADPAAFMAFVIENKLWDLMDRKANVTEVQEYVKQHNRLPPGVNLSMIEQIGVRSKSGKAED